MDAPLSSSSSSSNLFLSHFNSEQIKQLENAFSPSVWNTLEEHFAEERKLNVIKEKIMKKLIGVKAQIENAAEWEQLNVREKSKLVGEMQEHLYELQLVEHALKIPLLAISKIIFSLNPKRCVDRDSNQTKSKAPKRRKNELGGLGIGEMGNEEQQQGKSAFPVREAKLFAASQVQRSQQYEKMEEFCSFGVVKKGGAAGRLKRRATTPRNMLKNSNSASTTTTTAAVHSNMSSPTHSGWATTYRDEEVQQHKVEESTEDLEMMELNLISIGLKSPSPLANNDGSTDCLESPQRADSAQQQQMHSPPGTRMTRKKGREATNAGNGNGEGSGSALPMGGRSPRKKAISERQKHECEIDKGGEHLTNCEDDDDEQQTIATDEPTYCLCEQVSFGEMICCDYELCSVEWFHFACVNIKSKPKGKKWFCPLCRHNEKANTLKPELQQKMEQINKRTQ